MNSADHEETFSRLSLLVGASALNALQSKRVLVCGLGGVGSWAAEILVRTAISSIGILDFDTVKPSNINRQLLALQSTIGRKKTDVLAERLRDINPDLNLTVLDTQLTEDNIADVLGHSNWDCVIDAIDQRKPKIALLRYCLAENLPVISSLGTASKTHPELLTVADISETYGCPMAKILRKTLKHFGIESGIRVVYSPELPILPDGEAPAPECEGERRPLGTISFLPSMAGIRCAAEAIKLLLPNETALRRGQPAPTPIF